MCVTLQRTISFINNTAGQQGAAIYATDLEICTRLRPRLRDEEEKPHSNYFDESILALDPPFKFRYVALSSGVCNRLYFYNLQPSIVVGTGLFQKSTQINQTMQSLQEIQSDGPIGV